MEISFTEEELRRCRLALGSDTTLHLRHGQEAIGRECFGLYRKFGGTLSWESELEIARQAQRIIEGQ